MRITNIKRTMKRIKLCVLAATIIFSAATLTGCKKEHNGRDATLGFRIVLR